MISQNQYPDKRLLSLRKSVFREQDIPKARLLMSDIKRVQNPPCPQPKPAIQTQGGGKKR